MDWCFPTAVAAVYYVLTRIGAMTAIAYFQGTPIRDPYRLVLWMPLYAETGAAMYLAQMAIDYINGKFLVDGLWPWERWALKKRGSQ